MQKSQAKQNKDESKLSYSEDDFSFFTKDYSQISSLLKWKKRALVSVTLLSVCALFVVLQFILGVLSGPVSIIIWTAVFVFLLRGVVNFFANKGVNRVLATTIAYIIMFAVFGLIVFLVCSPVFGFNEQVKNILSNLPTYANKIAEWVKELYEKYADLLQNESLQELMNSTISSLSNIGSNFASVGAMSVVSFGAGLGSSIFAIGFGLVLAFWMLIELPNLGKEVSRFIKPKYIEDARMLQYTVTHVMSGYMRGTFFQCLIIGVASGLLFWILGISNSGALGCLTGLLNLIPIIGPWIGGAIAGVSGLFVSTFSALCALAGTIVIQQIVYTFISPKIMSDSVDIHPALSLLALVFGGAIGGAMSGLIGSLLGMLLSIPAVAVIKALFVYYYEKNTGQKIVSSKGVFFKGRPIKGNVLHPTYDAVMQHQKDIDAKMRQDYKIDKVKKES